MYYDKEGLKQVVSEAKQQHLQDQVEAMQVSKEVLRHENSLLEDKVSNGYFRSSLGQLSQVLYPMHR